MSGDFPELGSGEVRVTPGRTFVHFGSPSGTQYSPEPEKSTTKKRWWRREKDEKR